MNDQSKPHNTEAERRVPDTKTRSEIVVVNSRFITTVVPVSSVEQARETLRTIRAEMPDASHHVYAYRIGHGNSVTDGMSDDGEPSGTAGPPVLAILRGSGLGDILIIVTRYFGGTKLGTGGLVRAYSDATRNGLENTPSRLKIARSLLGFEVPYSLFEQTRRLVDAHNGVIEDQDFAGNVTLLARFESWAVSLFEHDLSELTAGQVQPVLMEESE